MPSSYVLDRTGQVIARASRLQGIEGSEVRGVDTHGARSGSGVTMRYVRCAAALAACAVGASSRRARASGSSPWQRGTLARDEMQVVSDPLEASVDDHIYFSKEASSGGRSYGGGGCGCN